jgi:hypothetical protein
MNAGELRADMLVFLTAFALFGVVTLAAEQGVRWLLRSRQSEPKPGMCSWNTPASALRCTPRGRPCGGSPPG